MTIYGWWEINLGLIVNNKRIRFADLDKATRERIAERIKNGYCSGDIVIETEQE